MCQPTSNGHGGADAQRQAREQHTGRTFWGDITRKDPQPGRKPSGRNGHGSGS